MNLAALTTQLHQSLGILHKQDIQTAARLLDPTRFGTVEPGAIPSPIRVGDDCAAIPEGDGYLLLAAEGLLPQLVETDPWFAGWCAVLVNVNDIYAMGGRPIAIVDTVWSRSIAETEPLWAGMRAAALTFNVPIVGGHTNCHSPYTALSVAILGRSQHLITSFDAQPGDRLVLVVDFQGRTHPTFPFWDAATTTEPQRLRDNLALLPAIAEAGLCQAGKDISMGGIVGTLLMLLETSGCGAVLDIDRVPCPATVSLDRWLISFPSYGFLLSVRPDRVAAVQAHFQRQGLVCASVGEVQSTPTLVLRSATESQVFWNLSQQPLTGFSTQT